MKLQSGPRQRPKSRETQREAGAVRHTTTALQIFRPVLLRLLLPPELRRYDKQGITLQLLALENRALLTLNPLPDSLVFQPQYTRCLRLCYLPKTLRAQPRSMDPMARKSAKLCWVESAITFDAKRPAFETSCS